MAQATVSIRMDEDLKKRMEKLCDDLGMNLTTAFTIFAKKATREHRIPFELDADPFYSESNLEFLRQGVEELRAGKGIRKTLEQLESMTDEEADAEWKSVQAGKRAGL